ILSSGNQVPCAQPNATSNPPCLAALKHSCQSVANPVFFGDPAVRLNTVIRAVPQHALSSICDDDYAPALDRAAKLIVSAIGGACIKYKLPRDAGGALALDCEVDDLIQNGDGTVTTNIVPQCPGNGANPGS